MGERVLTAEMLDAAARYGERHGVPSAISQDDHIFWYILDNSKGGVTDAVEEYLGSGVHAAHLLRNVLEQIPAGRVAERRAAQSLTVLEFASGYGRVTRHFPAVMPEAAVVACDIHAEAVAFLQQLGFDAEASSHQPDEFTLPQRFDVIYAFSFFTHMPRETWTAWLQALGRHLEDDGVLVFTAHGTISQGLMGVPALEEDGFFFHARSEQADLPEAEYGNTVTAFDFVHSQIAVSGLELLQFRQGGAGHHDLYVLHRPARAARHYVSRFERERNVLAGEIAQLRREIEAFQRSTSWRVTSPLRQLAKTLGRR